MKRLGSFLLVLALVVAAAPGVAAAESRTAPGVAVGPDEHTGDLTATGGSVVVYGTVDGDLEAYAGRVLIAENATVTGNVNAYAGAVRIEGTVEGQVVAYGGRVVQTPTATVRGSLGTVTGAATVGGHVRGDLTALAGRIRLDPTAVVGSDVNYEGTLVAAPGARVGGRTRRLRDLGVTPTLPPRSSPAFLLYGLASNLVLGALLVFGLGEFSEAVVGGAVLDPLSSLGHGLATALVAPSSSSASWSRSSASRSDSSSCSRSRRSGGSGPSTGGSPSGRGCSRTPTARRRGRDSSPASCSSACSAGRRTWDRWSGRRSCCSDSGRWSWSYGRGSTRDDRADRLTRSPSGPRRGTRLPTPGGR